MFRLVRLLATHLVWLAITCGKYCASFCVSGKRMKVKSGAVTCWPNPKTADNTSVQTARRTRRGTVTLLKPGKIEVIGWRCKRRRRGCAFFIFLYLKFTDSLYFSLF